MSVSVYDFNEDDNLIEPPKLQHSVPRRSLIHDVNISDIDCQNTKAAPAVHEQTKSSQSASDVNLTKVRPAKGKNKKSQAKKSLPPQPKAEFSNEVPPPIENGQVNLIIPKNVQSPLTRKGRKRSRRDVVAAAETESETKSLLTPSKRVRKSRSTKLKKIYDPSESESIIKPQKIKIKVGKVPRSKKTGLSTPLIENGQVSFSNIVSTLSGDTDKEERKQQMAMHDAQLDDELALTPIQHESTNLPSTAESLILPVPSEYMSLVTPSKKIRKPRLSKKLNKSETTPRNKLSTTLPTTKVKKTRSKSKKLDTCCPPPENEDTFISPIESGQVRSVIQSNVNSMTFKLTERKKQMAEKQQQRALYRAQLEREISLNLPIKTEKPDSPLAAEADTIVRNIVGQPEFFLSIAKSIDDEKVTPTTFKRAAKAGKKKVRQNQLLAQSKSITSLPIKIPIGLLKKSPTPPSSPEKDAVTFSVDSKPNLTQSIRTETVQSDSIHAKVKPTFRKRVSKLSRKRQWDSAPQLEPELSPVIIKAKSGNSNEAPSTVSNLMEVPDDDPECPPLIPLLKFRRKRKPRTPIVAAVKRSTRVKSGSTITPVIKRRLKSTAIDKLVLFAQVESKRRIRVQPVQNEDTAQANGPPLEGQGDEPIQNGHDRSEDENSEEDTLGDTLFQMLKPPKHLTPAQKKAKVEGRPIGARTSYAYFVQLCSDEYKMRFPKELVHCSFFNTICGQRWKTLTPVERWSFDDMARRDQLRYDEEMKIYLQSLDDGYIPSETRTAKKSKSPKKTL